MYSVDQKWENNYKYLKRKIIFKKNERTQGGTGAVLVLIWQEWTFFYCSKNGWWFQIWGFCKIASLQHDTFISPWGRLDDCCCCCCCSVTAGSLGSGSIWSVRVLTCKSFPDWEQTLQELNQPLAERRKRLGRPLVMDPKSVKNLVKGEGGVWLVKAKQAENTKKIKWQKTPGKLCHG